MEEKRKYKRLPIKLELTISKLFKQDYKTISDISEGIVVKDISKSGIGFTCKKELPLDYYFDAKIQLSDEQYFYSVLKIIRVNKIDDGYSVGCEFVGLADILSSRVDIYENEISHKE
jgi:hypothetical protein